MIAVSAPMPSPANARQMNSSGTECAVPMSRLHAQKMSRAPIMIFRRPNLSARTPAASAPTRYPKNIDDRSQPEMLAGIAQMTMSAESA